MRDAECILEELYLFLPFCNCQPCLGKRITETQLKHSISCVLGTTYKLQDTEKSRQVVICLKLICQSFGTQ